MPPVNDNLANATTLPGTSGTIAGTTLGATVDTPYDPLNDITFGYGDSYSVWYKLAVPAGWDPVTSKLVITIDNQDLLLFKATTYPPASSSDWTQIGSYTGGGVTYTGVSPGSFFYLGVGSFSTPNVFTLTWAFTIATPISGVSVAFDAATLDPYATWTDLSQYANVRHWTIDRGRSSELDKTQTGQAEIDLIDLAGNLDPLNLAGPFAGKIDPMKQAAIAITNPVTLEVSTLIRGFADWLEFDYDGSTGYKQTLKLEINDAFDLFTALQMVPGRHGHTPPVGSSSQIYFQGEPGQWSAGTFKHVDGRITDALNTAGWSTVLRDEFTGNVTVQEAIYERLDQLLSVLQDAADAEFPGVANVLMSRDGMLRFRGRFARFNPTKPGYGIAYWSCGTKDVADADATVAPVSHLTCRRSKDDIINGCLTLPAGVNDTQAPAAFVYDATSVAKYGWRVRTWQDLLVYQGHDDAGNTTTAMTEVGKISNYYVGNYKTPKTRISRLTFRGQDPGAFSGPALWALICGVEIGDLIHVQTTHPGGGGFNEDFYVEGIHYDAQPMTAGYPEITLDLDVSPRAFYGSNPFGTKDSGV